MQHQTLLACRATKAQVRVLPTPCQAHRLGRVQRQAVSEIGRERGRELHRLVAVRRRRYHHGIRPARQVGQVQLTAVSRRVAILIGHRSAAGIAHPQIHIRRRVRRHDVAQRQAQVLSRRGGETQIHGLPRRGRRIAARRAVDRRGAGDRRGEQQSRAGRLAVIRVDEDRVRPVHGQLGQVQGSAPAPRQHHTVQLRPIRRIDRVIHSGIGRCRTLPRDLQHQTLLACRATKAQVRVLPTPCQAHRLGRVQRQAVGEIGRERGRELHRLVAVRWRRHHYGIRPSRQVGQVHLTAVSGCVAILRIHRSAARIAHLQIQRRRRIRRHDVAQRQAQVLTRRRGETQIHILPWLGGGVASRRAIDRRGAGDRRREQHRRVGRLTVRRVDKDRICPIRGQLGQVQGSAPAPRQHHAVQLRPIRRIDGVIHIRIGRRRALTRDL